GHGGRGRHRRFHGQYRLEDRRRDGAIHFGSAETGADLGSDRQAGRPARHAGAEAHGRQDRPQRHQRRAIAGPEWHCREKPRRRHAARLWKRHPHRRRSGAQRLHGQGRGQPGTARRPGAARARRRNPWGDPPVSVIRSAVTGVGSFLPEKVVTNADLAKFVDTSDEWIVERTGIHQRHQARDDEPTSDLAVEAARRALADAGKTAADVDLIIVATTTPDKTFPATAAIVQAKLGAPVGIAFDVQAVCSGFVYAMSVADGFVARGMAKCALVIGAEEMTRLMDWTDRTTCVLFGDGAGAFVLEPGEGQGTKDDRG